MPEIGEVARIVHFLHKYLVGKTIAKVVAPDDANVFGKVGCSGPAFEKALTGKKVVGAGQQGKYFWLEMEKAPHPCFHFGMTGWMHIKGEQTYYYKRSTPEEQTDWPPRFWKFTLETKESPKVEAAFTDARRFARIRLLDCPGSDIRNTTPLKENGPDPVIDKDVLTLEWLSTLMKRKHVPVKALLLDQANISGIGNWVGDEIMYHAKLHPEQYSDTFSDAQLAQLHKSLTAVCGTAVETLSDSSKFPDEWLFKHRWGKGKKDAATTLPTGEKLAFVTVGGRTSCIVPSVQKKTGPVAADVKIEDANGKDEKPTKGKKAKDLIKIEAEEDPEGESPKKARSTKKKTMITSDDSGLEGQKNNKRKEAPDSAQSSAKKAIDGTKKAKKKVNDERTNIPEDGRRRSGRLRK